MTWSFIARHQEPEETTVSNADKRTVATDALETLGTVITENEKRDAIHLAVEPVVAAHVLRPGEDVGFLGDGTVGKCDKPVGIVDPFLKQFLKRGDRFWLVVYPRQITSLRHVWTHPAFDDEPRSQPEPQVTERPRATESQRWMEEYARSLGSHYNEVMSRANDFQEIGEYWSEGDRFESEELPDEFWDHYAAITGTVPKDRWSFFSCSC